MKDVEDKLLIVLLMKSTLFLCVFFINNKQSKHSQEYLSSRYLMTITIG